MCKLFLKKLHFFCDNTYIVTGSDCGNMFIWEKESGKLLQVLKADNNVVNGIAPHPSLPILAACGIDSDGKVFEVSSTKTMSQKYTEEAVETNEAQESSGGEGLLNIFQFWDLIRNLRSQAGEEESEDEDFEPEDDNALDKIKSADELRAAANEFFKGGRYQEALEMYGEALSNLDFESNSPTAIEKQDAAQTLCRLNRAACSLKLGDNDNVITDCTFVLEQQPENIKALCRRGNAYLNKNELFQAKQDLLKANKLLPDDPSIKSLLQQLKEKRDKEDEKSDKSAKEEIKD